MTLPLLATGGGISQEPRVALWPRWLSLQNFVRPVPAEISSQKLSPVTVPVED